VGSGMDEAADSSALLRRAEELQREKDEKQNALEVLIRRVEGLQYGKFCILLVAADLDQPSLIILH